VSANAKLRSITGSIVPSSISALSGWMNGPSCRGPPRGRTSQADDALGREHLLDQVRTRHLDDGLGEPVGCAGRPATTAEAP